MTEPRKALAALLVANGLAVGLPLVGVPTVVAMLIAAPFALLAGWTFVPPMHVCGWCGRRFSGSYEWVCPDCEGEALSWTEGGSR